MADSVGLFGAVKGLFEYNRENFIFDRTLNQQRVYQIQKMRVAQVKLYRDDLRHLFDLTIRKMDMYLLFDILLLLFEGGLFYDGRLPAGSPAWLLWLWTMSLGSAMFFLTLSVFFAIHASITAQTFQVRLLTQWLRLPIPSARDIHAAAAAATEFEETRARDMLRVPGVVVPPRNTDPFQCIEKFPDVPNELLKSDLTSDYTLFVEHFYLFRDMQRHWQGFDAYCRIGMVIGLNMLLTCLSYTAIAYFLISFKVLGGLVFPVILTVLSVVHMKMNIRDLSRFEEFAIYVLNVLPVTLACIAGVQSALDDNTWFADLLSPVIFVCSGLWVVFLTLLGSEDDGGLPCRFVTVSSIDVLGLDEDDTKFISQEKAAANDDVSAAPFKQVKEGDNSTAEDTPVAVAVPTAAIIAKGEERRRKILTDLDRHDSTESRIGQSTVSEREGRQNDKESNDQPMSAPITGEEILNSYILSNQHVSSAVSVSDSVASGQLAIEALEGIAPVVSNEEDEIRAYKHSNRARTLPWRSFRETGAVLTCLWVFAVVYSILASFQPRWGWPRTMPHGDGEDESYSQASGNSLRRLLDQPITPILSPVHFELPSSGAKVVYNPLEDFGKIMVWSNDGENFLSSVDVGGSLVDIWPLDGTNCAVVLDENNRLMRIDFPEDHAEISRWLQLPATEQLSAAKYEYLCS